MTGVTRFRGALAALLLVGLLDGCGSPPASVVARKKPKQQQTESPRPPPGALWRHEVVAIVDAGLGRFLGFVPIEPVMEGERFVGFRILGLYPREAWQDVDLKPGDVVTEVNGQGIGRVTEAFAVFKQLRDAKEIRVRFLRDEEERELRYEIVEQEGIVIPPPPEAKPSSTP